MFGTCQNTNTSYTCTCNTGYTGKDCQIGEYDIFVYNIQYIWQNKKYFHGEVILSLQHVYTVTI